MSTPELTGLNDDSELGNARRSRRLFDEQEFRKNAYYLINNYDKKRKGEKKPNRKSYQDEFKNYHSLQTTLL